MAEDFDPDAWLKKREQQPQVPPGVGKRAGEKPVDPLYSSGETFTTRTAKQAWPYVKAAGTGAAKEIAGDVQTIGELLPDPLSPLLPDVAKQAREEGRKGLREWTESEDPEHPDVEKAGRFGGGVAEAWALPLPKIGAAAAKGVERAGKAIFPPPKGPPMTPRTWSAPAKPIAPTVRGAGGKMTGNPAYQAAKEAAKEAWELRMDKVEKVGEGVGKATDAAARGAVAGGVQPGKEDKDAAAATGAGVGATMSVLNTAYTALPPKFKKAVDFTVAAPIAYYFAREMHMSPERAMLAAVTYASTHSALHHWRLMPIPEVAPAAAAIMGSPLGQSAGAAAAVRAPEVLGKR